MAIALADRFWAKVDRRGDDECWLWTASLNPVKGYGEIHVSGRTIAAHRVAYELSTGAVPTGAEVDHVCHTKDRTCPGGPTCPHRRCVNPNHLEAVTPTENRNRTRGRKDHCKWGHRYTEADIRPPPQHRQCHACASEYLGIQARAWFALQEALHAA